MCFAVEPGSERKGGRNVWGLFEEPQEDGLGDVTGCFVISSNAPGDGKDEGEEPLDERGESATRGVAQVLLQKLVVAG